MREQRATIEHPRGLLERVLSHQVAERSRELGDVRLGVSSALQT
jgi:hypothetical protein